jgi:hypothetical protein
VGADCSNAPHGAGVAVEEFVWVPPLHADHSDAAMRTTLPQLGRLMTRM